MKTLNPRHERFAQLVAEGKTQADAYRETYPQSKRWKADSIHGRASKVNAMVLPRVRELQAELAKRSNITKEEVVAYLSNVVRGPENSFGSKLAAIEQLAKLLGWYTPQKMEQNIRFAADEAVAAKIGAELERVRIWKDQKRIAG